MELRDLKATDVWTVLKILNKANITEDISRLIKDGDLSSLTVSEDDATEKNATQIGMAIVGELGTVVIDKLPLAEKEVNAFLADLAGVKTSEIEALGIKEYFNLIKSFLSNIKNPPKNFLYSILPHLKQPLLNLQK